MTVQALVPLVLIALVAYLLILRPARRRSQATARLQAALTPGSEVMLSSGLFGTLIDLRDEIAHIELAPGLVVRVHRGAVTQIIVDQPPPAVADDDLRTVSETSGDDNAGVN